MSADELAALTLSDDKKSETTTKDTDERPSTEDSNAEERQPNRILTSYLKTNSPELQELGRLRKKGWTSPEADEFFRKQREHADKSSIKDEQYFYGMMKRNGTQLHKETSAFYIPFASGRDPRILDMCMAPGAFLDTALKFNPYATAVACSLPTDQGGHPILMPENPRAEIHLVDITMLAEDMGVTAVPTNHPEAGKFLPRTLPNERAFDLVICDGQVLRTHELAEYRAKGEPRRLSASQLAIGLERLRPGGTIILLLHQVEAWRSALIIYAFSKFAKIMLFKPPVAHAKRSSFYLIAKNVQSESPEALAAVERWKEIWKAETFPPEGERSVGVEDPWTAEEIIGDFGPELLKLGAPIWTIQANALASASFMK